MEANLNQINVQPHETSGCSPLSSSNFEKDGFSSEYRDFLDRLVSDTAISQWIDLPILCVVGDTSSGKSSLLSNISMIELPCSHALTTRCPVLLKLRRRDEHLAVIRVHWKTLDDAPLFPERRISKDEWSSIPKTIQEAQEFILAHTKKEVSKDIIHVEVESPDCSANLTLLDLPGLVRSRAEDESCTLPSDVQELVDEYLLGKRSVILAVHSASNDFHNSQMLADVVNVDSSRTIPVLTKPDLVDPGAEQSVLDLLLGKKLSFATGFQMVKGRGQAALDRGDSIAQGLLDEQSFFNQTEPWKSVPDRSLFGTEQLRRKLSDLHMSMIRESFPGILREIRQRKQIAQSTLREMGDLHNTVQDSRRYYHDICQTLVSKLRTALKGRGTTKPSPATKMHEACSGFMNAIRAGSLGTVRSIVEGAQVLVASPKGYVCGEVVHLDADFACVDFVHPIDRQSEVLFEFVGRQSEELIEENEVWSDGSKVYIARTNNVYDSLRKVPITCIRTDPTWLKDKMSDNRSDELACFLDVDMFKGIVGEFIEEDWTPHCNALLDRTDEITREILNSALNDTFKTNRYPLLRSLFDRQCRKVASELLIQALQQVETHLRMERHPYTQDHVLFENLSSARHRSLRRELEIALRLDKEGVYDTKAIKTIMDSVFERNQRKTVEDHMAEEMELVLESYGEIATKRVIDRTPMICWEVLRSLADTIQDSLLTTTDETLLQCMQESEEFSAKYRATQEELKEMSKALDILNVL